jgi:hypothetical protein
LEYGAETNKYGIPSDSKCTPKKLGLGGKILWRIVPVKKRWVSEVLRKKYLQSIALICLDMRPTTQGSAIWKLCKEA